MNVLVLRDIAAFLWQWLVFVPLFLLLTLLGAIISIPVARLVSPRAANLGVAVPWARLVAWLSLVRVEVVGREHLDPARSYVVVVNHQSQMDIPVVYGFSGLDLRWVMKAELRRTPLIGAGCAALGHVFIDRANPDRARSAINRALPDIRGRTGILFFPEGTRSRSGELMRFKKGAFRVAIERGLPVLPMTVTGTRDILPADSLRIRPGRVRLVIHPPIATEGLSLNELRDLREAARTRIAAGLHPPLETG